MNSMKKNRKKMTLICLLCFSFLLTGCKIGNKEVIVSNTLNNRQVFRIGNVSCGLKEAKVYLVNYQNIYGTAYGLDLWQHDFGDSSLENYVKNITMRELAQVVCLDQLAKEKEMELSEEEKEKTAQAAEEYFASLTEEETAYMGVSESDIKEYYEHYALAQKVYHSLTKAVNEEVSDDEARVMEIMQIAREPASLETPIGEEEDSHLGDFIQDDNVPVPADAAAFTLLKEQLVEVLSTLTDREQKVLRLRFGLDDGRARTLEEVGKEFNVTRERIRQIEAKALRKLRHPSRSRKLKDYLD